MTACTFFGHRDCPDAISKKLRQVIRKLIEEKHVDTFYVGNQGRFDAMVYRVLQELKEAYPQIECTIVLAYLNYATEGHRNGQDTLWPEGIECVPRKYAIAWRNDWMLRNAKYVVTYVITPTGGAAQYYRKAIKAGKTVINLPEFSQAVQTNIL